MLPGRAPPLLLALAAVAAEVFKKTALVGAQNYGRTEHYLVSFFLLKSLEGAVNSSDDYINTDR
jgi:hypothetical protein